MHVDVSAVPRSGTSGRALLATYTATIFLSAFLLFSVQPMFAKLVLPRLGGSPGVWSVAMVFFQSMLLLGYAYAHILTSRFSIRTASFIHVGVLVIAFIALPLSIPEGWGAPPESGQTLWLLGLFTAGVGLPFFAVSANGPLLQAWFARSGHAHAADPYFLYGASNIGSFASLILYILFFEPQFGLSTQTMLWSAGFLALTAAIGACALLILGRATDATDNRQAESALEAPTWRLRALWVALAFIPSGLLVAVTAHISTDIAAAPFLWVIPLALFLLTFVLAFQRQQWLPETLLRKIVPFAAAAVLIELSLSLVLNTAVTVAFHLSFFFLAALYCHTRMVDNRPKAAYLTEFYLLMSVGGVLGGVFASLIAMHLFDSIFEYPILIAAALLARKSIYGDNTSRTLRAGAVALLVGAGIYALIASGTLPFPEGSNWVLALQILLLLLGTGQALSYRESEPRAVACTVLFLPLALLLASVQHDLYSKRTFFGSLSVRTSDEGTHNAMYHGTTLHGAQLIADLEHGGPPKPLTYYHESGAIRASLAASQERGADRARTVGVVGLGTGSLLCHRKPNETWTLYEIDRSVVDLASDPSLFSFVSECGPKAEMVVGDARITLGAEERGPYDYLLIDAFSSDAIPVHLLTREAVQLYVSRLTETGILAIHISNRNMDMRPIVARIAQEEGLVSRTAYFGGAPFTDDAYAYPNRVVVLARDEAHLGPVILDDDRWAEPSAVGADLWTDDYSNILKLLLQ
jgi:spermidine synthase